MHNLSYVKFGKQKVTLRPFWSKQKRWKRQYILEYDTDVFAENIMNIIN